MRTVFISGFWGLLALIWIFMGSLYLQGSRPMNDDTNLQIFEVESGMTLKRVAQKLSSQKLILSASAFQAIGLIQNKQKLIMVGEYHISPSMLPVEILQKITSGKTILYPVTIPEGYRITEIANLLEEQGLANKEVFLQQSKNFRLLFTFNISINMGFSFF